ncbi:MAG: hypothetical protein WCF92_00915 [bacterium]
MKLSLKTYLQGGLLNSTNIELDLETEEIFDIKCRMDKVQGNLEAIKKIVEASEFYIKLGFEVSLEPNQTSFGAIKETLIIVVAMTHNWVEGVIRVSVISC